MKKIVVEGSRSLKGTVKAAGSKNAALPILISTLLTDDPCAISNIPWLEDIRTTVGILEHCGKKVERHGERFLITKAREAKTSAPYELVKRMRASVLVAGPLLARYHQVKVSLPGGCAIGTRPINIHLAGFGQFGAKIKLSQGFVTMSSKGPLRGQELILDFPSVGATENLLMAASLAQGKTVIANAALEPEIEDLARFLTALGARISGIGTKKLIIQGVERLHGANHDVIADRIEAATYLLGGAITRGDVTVKDMEPAHLEALLAKLKQAGHRLEIKGKSVRIRPGSSARPINIQTAPHPGFATDLQPLWVSLMSITPGKSIIKETVFENRFMHAAELNRMGASIRVNGNTAVVQGVPGLSGAPVMCADLRAGAALLLAALAAKGRSDILRIYHLDRGYAELERKFRSLGAKVKRVEA